MTDTRDEGRQKASAVPIEDQAQRLREHYEEAATALGHWSNQIPVAIDEWEQRRLRADPSGEDEIPTRDVEWHGWERFYSPREAKPRLHIGPIPGRKQIALYEHTGSVVVPFAYFRDKNAARRFMAVMDYIVLGEELDG